MKLLRYVKEKFGLKKVGLMLINNPPGESNEKGLVEAEKAEPGNEIVEIGKFEVSLYGTSWRWRWERRRNRRWCGRSLG